jgi:hemolysin III
MKKSILNLEEQLNGLSHGIAAVMSILGLFVLIYVGATNETNWSLTCALIYGISLIVTFSASALYHLKSGEQKNSYRILDHSSIFLLIAGTYTPLLLLHIKGEWGMQIFILQWALTVCGILLKIFFTGKFDYLFILMYIIMGWIIIFKIEFLIATLSPNALALMVTGGLAYTIGIIFYIMDEKIKFAHLIWHLFVIVGSLTHYLFITCYIL